MNGKRLLVVSIQILRTRRVFIYQNKKDKKDRKSTKREGSYLSPKKKPKRLLSFLNVSRQKTQSEAIIYRAF